MTCEYYFKRLRENQDSSDRISLVHQVRRKDQILRWFSLNALKYKEEDGVPVYRIVNIDVTESRENELLIEQKNEELGICWSTMLSPAFITVLPSVERQRIF